MSGYLQRLIARSTTTHSAIHPQSRLAPADFSPLEPPVYSELNAPLEHLRQQPAREQNAQHEPFASHLSAVSAAGVANTEFVLAKPTVALAQPITAATHKDLSEFGPASRLQPPRTQSHASLANTEFAITQPRVALAQSRVKLAEDLLVTDAPDAFRLMEAASAIPTANTANILPHADVRPGRTLGAHRPNPIRLPLPPFGNQLGNETTEVHVHIGRIEVTAIPGETQTKRTPVARRTPQSLDDYLAKRSKT